MGRASFRSSLPEQPPYIRLSMCQISGRKASWHCSLGGCAWQTPLDCPTCWSSSSICNCLRGCTPPPSRLKIRTAPSSRDSYDTYAQNPGSVAMKHQAPTTAHVFCTCLPHFWAAEGSWQPSCPPLTSGWFSWSMLVHVLSHQDVRARDPQVQGRCWRAR